MDDKATPSGESLGVERLTECLKRPSAYGELEHEIGFLQTHISLLFFAGKRVYKIKKPVDFGFLDFTSLTKRKLFCDEEVRLNRRLAPEIYLGVVPITRSSAGTLHVNGVGEVVEWAVEMVRLPEHRMFSSLLERGEIDNQQMNSLASLIAEFHGSCPTGQDVDPYGAPAVIEGNHKENFEQLQDYVAHSDRSPAVALQVLSAAQHEFLSRNAQTFFSEQRELLLRRVNEHRVREGHGDLHAGNICFAEDGIVAYDCIEFSRRFRCGDVASELAFLAMDLDYRGYPSFGTYLVKRYAQICGDAELEKLEPFYKCYRAVVRGKVTALTASDPAIRAARRAELRLEAMRYLQLAVGYHLPPVLILMCGLPACGKSWLAKRLKRPLRASLLRSDVRRKRMPDVARGTQEDGQYGKGLYSEQRKASTYDSLLENAVELLQANRSVVLDATFSRSQYRAPFLEAANRLGFKCLLVHVKAADEIIRERLQVRENDPHCVSDAGLEVYQQELQRFEPPAELPAHQVLELSSGIASAEEHCSAVIDGLIAVQGP